MFTSLPRMMKLTVQYNKYDWNKTRNYKYINSSQYKYISAYPAKLCIDYRGVFRAVFNIYNEAFFA